MKSRTNVYVTVLLAGATLLSTGAMASPPSERMLTRTETVKYSPTKATTLDGAAELYEKLRAAAAKVCSSKDTGFSPYDAQDAYEACTNKAIRQAVTKVHSPLLMALHLQDTSMRPASAKADAATVAQR
jgi:UrcA family protein